jgi:hypothetical protein
MDNRSRKPEGEQSSSLSMNSDGMLSDSQGHGVKTR